MANSLINQASVETSAPAPSKPDTRVWLYKGKESRLFESKADVPEGEDWREAPYEPEEEPKKKGKKAEAKDTATETQSEPVSDGDGN